MTRPLSADAREKADLYATQAVLVEVIRYLSAADPHIVIGLREALKRGPIKPVDDDVIVGEDHVRDSFEHLLNRVNSVESNR